MPDRDEPRDWSRSYHIAMRDRVAVSYEPHRQKTPIRLEDPVPYFAGSALLSPQEALQPKWAALITAAGADWFLALIRRMAAGEAVSLEQVAQAYREANGSEMRTLQDEINATGH